MKLYYYMAILCLVGNSAFAQKNINQSASTAGINEVFMDFKYPELIKVSSWEKDEISISGNVLINNGENNDAFKITIERDGTSLTVASIIENLENLPKKILIKTDGNKYYFDTDNFNDPKVQAFIEEKGGGHQYQMHGVIKEISLDIKVPQSVKLNISAKYGLIEVIDVQSPLSIDAKYGGIDISLTGTSPRDIVARTKYGEMFSDLDLKIDRSSSKSGDYYKWTTVVANLNGGGTLCNLESKYGNVYIRNK